MFTDDQLRKKVKRFLSDESSDESWIDASSERVEKALVRLLQEVRDQPTLQEKLVAASGDVEE